MDRFTIEVTNDGATYNFDIVDFVHDEDFRCKFEVYKNDRFIASFEPDGKGILHICKNEGIVDEPILHLLADKIESYNL